MRFVRLIYINTSYIALQTPKKLGGGAGVLQDPDYAPPSYRDENGSVPENEVFHIQKGKNDVLVLRANGEEQPIVIDDLASQDGKNIREMCAFLNGKLNAHDLLVSYFSHLRQISIWHEISRCYLITP